MKLPIQKKYFDALNNEEEEYEFRDAHISYICEETGKKITMDVEDVELISKDLINSFRKNKLSDKELKELFSDDIVIKFKVRKK